MKKLGIFLLGVVPVLVLLSFSAMNPPKVEAVPSYARQTGLACSGCHYTPPELNPAGRRFKLLGYVDRADETKTVKADGGKKRAALDQAELNLQYTRIVAPVSGEVNKTVVVGLNVQPGQQLLTIVPLEDVWVTANFKETQLTYMRAGQPVSISIDAYPARSFSGHVDSLQAGSGTAFALLPAENATGNYVKIVQRVPVKIVFDDKPDVLLGPGMSIVPTVRVR